MQLPLDLQLEDMTKDINFLTIKNIQKKKARKGLRNVRVAAILSLILVVLLSAALFYLNRKIYPQSLKNERDSLLKGLSVLHNREAKLAISSNRIENISELLNKRVDYSKIVSKFFEKKPSQINIDSLRIDKKTILLTISSNSLEPINEFIDGLIELGQKKEITVLLLDSLSLSEASGTYSVSFTVNL